MDVVDAYRGSASSSFSGAFGLDPVSWIERNARLSIVMVFTARKACPPSFPIVLLKRRGRAAALDL